MQAKPTGDAAATQTALQLLTTFQTVQAERSQLYSQLSAGFKQYVSKPQEERDEIGYRVLMEHVTRGFADCSKKVLAVESCLTVAPVSRLDLAALLRRVQEGEREKLQVTVSLQALKTAVALRADRRRMQQQDAHAAHAGGAPEAAEHGHMEHACCGHAHGAGHACGAGAEEVEEASEEECDAAVREILQRLDRCVVTINDALEEVRYELAELKQEE